MTETVGEAPGPFPGCGWDRARLWAPGRGRAAQGRPV